MWCAWHGSSRNSSSVWSRWCLAWVDWQVRPKTSGRAAAAATVNRRAAAARAFFEYLVLFGVRQDNPVPVARRGQGLGPKARGVLGHLAPGRVRGGGRLVRQQRLLPESLAPNDVADFLADLGSHRDRAIVLAMVLGGLRVGEVRRLRLPDVDQGRRQLRLVGKGGRERIVPVDDAFFTELAAYLRCERPPGLATPECFVVLHGPTAGQPLTEAGLRSLFRYHRQTSGAVRVRPHRLRHTYGTELAAAGMDLLVLRQLMGHYAGDLVKWIMSGSVVVESGKQSVEDLLAAEWSFVDGVVALGLQGGAEFDGGLEEGAGLADRFEMAVQPDGAGAVRR